MSLVQDGAHEKYLHLHSRLASSAGHFTRNPELSRDQRATNRAIEAGANFVANAFQGTLHVYGKHHTTNQPFRNLARWYDPQLLYSVEGFAN